MRKKGVSRTFRVMLGVVVVLLGFAQSLASALAADGDLDGGFGTGGKVTTDVGSNDAGNAVVVQTDGKIVVGGTDGANFVVIRYNNDGTLDTTFGGTGKVTTDFGDTDRIHGLAIDANSKIVAAGATGNDLALARYNSNGQLDTTFGAAGQVATDFNLPGTSFTNAEGQAVAIAADGKIIVAGYVRNGSEFNDFLLVRYNSDGTLDTTFNSTGALPGIVTTAVQQQEEDQAYAVAIQTNGKLVVVGDTKGTPGIFAMVRYNSNGSIDTGFGTGGAGIVFAANNKVATGHAIALQSDGKIVVAGAKSIEDLNGSNCTDSFAHYCAYLDFWVARYSSDGLADSTFGTNGEMTTNINARGNDDQGRAVVIQADSKIVVAGHADISTHTFINNGQDEIINRTDDFALVRYNSDGTLDTTFGANGKVLTNFAATSDDAAFAVARQPDGKIVAVGASDKNFAVARYQTGGKASTTTTLAAAPNPSKVEQAVTFTATVTTASGTPTGMVFFAEKVGSNSNTLGTVQLNNGIATFTTNTLPAGQHSIAATYDGDAKLNGSTSNRLTQNVTKVETTFDLRSSTNGSPADVGVEVIFTACLLPKSDQQTGTITPYHEGGALGGPLPLKTVTVDGAPCRGITFSEKDLTAGKHSIRVEYSGDSRFNKATSPILEQFINGKRTVIIELRTSPNPAAIGAKVTLIAHAFPDSGLQTGNVTFFDGTTALGTAALAGGCGSGGIPCQEAKLETSALTVGSHTITAQYAGNSEFNPATSPAVIQTITSQTVAPAAPITLTVSSGNKAMKLQWNVINDPAVVGYRILRTAGLNDSPTVIEENWRDLVYLDSKSLVSGLTYCYRVEARRGDGTLAVTSNRVCLRFGLFDLYMPDTIGRPGETVILPLNIRNADGLRITSSDIWLEFNGDIIESVSISRTALTASYAWSSAVQATNSPPTKRLVIAYINLQPEALHGDGSLFWLNFKVKGQPGQQTPLDLKEFISVIGGTSIQEFANPGEDVPLALTDGLLSVKSATAPYILGDVDGDGVVRAADALEALKVTTQKSTATTAKVLACDVNGNGKCDAADASMILFYATRHTWPLPTSPLPLISATAQHGAAVVRLGSAQAQPGQKVTIALSGESLTEIAGGTFTIAYDTGVVKRVGNVTQTGLAANFQALDFNDNGSGLLTIALSNDSEISGTGDLLTIELELQSSAPLGASSLTLASAELNDSFGRDFITSFADHQLTRQNGTITVGEGGGGADNTIYLPVVSR